jgi:hypothetical protein
MTGHRSEHHGQNTYSGHKRRHKRRHKPPPKLPKYVLELFWFCTECQGGLYSAFIEHCPSCQHLRCPNCHIEEHKVRRGECSTTLADFLSIQALMRQTSRRPISPKLPPGPNAVEPAGGPAAGLTGPCR